MWNQLRKMADDEASRYVYMSMEDFQNEIKDMNQEELLSKREELAKYAGKLLGLITEYTYRNNKEREKGILKNKRTYELSLDRLKDRRSRLHNKINLIEMKLKEMGLENLWGL